MPKLIKSFALSLFSSLLLTGLIITPVISAQDSEVLVDDTPFEKQYANYQAKFKQYDTLHQEYVVKRSQYMRFKTLTSQEDAYDATLAMLLARNDVLVAYFQSLKEKLKEGEDIPDDAEARLILTIDDEVGWLTTHQNQTSTAGTLDDLVTDSKTASSRFANNQTIIAYESLAAFSLGRMLGYERRTQDLYDDLKKKIDEVRSETREGYTFSAGKFQVLDRWMFDAETRITRAKQKTTDAQSFFSTKNIKSKGTEALNQYNNTLKTLGEAQLFLKEANTFMSEVIRELKTAEN